MASGNARFQLVATGAGWRVAGLEHDNTRTPPRAVAGTQRDARPEPAGTGSGKAAAAKPEASRPSRTPAAPEPAGTTPNEIVQQFAAAFEAGNLKALVRLFTPDAEVNDGRGTDFIRRDYAELFSTTSARRLGLSGLSWQTAGDGSFTGEGPIAASIRNTLVSPWRELRGTIRFELVRGKDGLRIAKMLHTL